jgi:hypothetical protein
MIRTVITPQKQDVSIKSFPMYLESATQNINSKTESMLPKIDGTYSSQLAGPLLKTGNPLRTV